MQDFKNSSDETQEIRASKILNEALMNAKRELSRWMVEAEVEVEVENLDVVIRVKKPYGGDGIITRIPSDVAVQNFDDIPSLTRSVVDEVMRTLYAEQIYNILHDKIFMAVKNITVIRTKL